MKTYTKYIIDMAQVRKDKELMALLKRVRRLVIWVPGFDKVYTGFQNE